MAHCATMVERGEALGPFAHPTVLLTRPKRSSLRFLERLQQTGKQFEPIIAPAFEIEATGAVVPEHQGAIFTSKAAVDLAPKGAGVPAFCVGDATARAATQRGYAAQSAGGDVDDLLRLILAQGSVGTLVHLRGEKSRGDVKAQLTRAGLSCVDVVLYRKARQGLSQQTAAKLREAETLLVPAFSAETVSILHDWAAVPKGATVIAMSAAVAAEATKLAPSKTIISERPNLSSMTQAVSGLIA